MFVIIVGCGRTGSSLAYRMFRAGHDVTVIDHVGTSFEHLPPDYRGRTITGEVLAEDVLRRAGIEQADGLAAVTNSDSVNAVVGHVAKHVFHVKTVVVRNYDPRYRSLHEALGLESVGSTAWGAQRTEEILTRVGGHSVFAAGNGEVEVYEVVVPPAWSGRSLRELLPAACLPAALTRGGQASLPAPDMVLQAGDVVHVSATFEGVQALRARVSREG